MPVERREARLDRRQGPLNRRRLACRFSLFDCPDNWGILLKFQLFFALSPSEALESRSGIDDSLGLAASSLQQRSTHRHEARPLRGPQRRHILLRFHDLLSTLFAIPGLLLRIQIPLQLSLGLRTSAQLHRSRLKHDHYCRACHRAFRRENVSWMQELDPE